MKPIFTVVFTTFIKTNESGERVQDSKDRPNKYTASRQIPGKRYTVLSSLLSYCRFTGDFLHVGVHTAL